MILCPICVDTFMYTSKSILFLCMWMLSACMTMHNLCVKVNFLKNASTWCAQGDKKQTVYT